MEQADCGRELCTLCGALEAAACCATPHYACRLCRAAYVRAFEKMGVAGVVCPVVECQLAMALPPRDEEKAGAPPRGARMEKVAAADPALATVRGLFAKTLDAGWITDVYRVSNPALQVLFEACAARLAKEGRRVGAKEVGANEALLWHSTARAAAGAIIREGFDIRRAGSAFGTALGIGIYLSPHAAFSHRYSKEDSSSRRCVLLCRVLLGDTTGRDSKSDGQAAPDQYVVGRECQILPSYCVYYSAK